jgi:hypothetical protein
MSAAGLLVSNEGRYFDLRRLLLLSEHSVMLLHNELHIVYSSSSVLMALEPLWALAAFQSPDLLTIIRTLWTSDHLVSRPLPKHSTAQTQNKHMCTPNMHSLIGIRTHVHSVRASEDSSFLRRHH